MAKTPRQVRDEIAKLALPGVRTYDEIADSVGVPAPEVMRIWATHRDFVPNRVGTRRTPPQVAARDRIIEMFKAGRKTEEVVKETGLSRARVLAVWRRCPEWEPRKTRVAPETVALIVRLFQEGLTTDQVGAATGYSGSSAHKIWRQSPEFAPKREGFGPAARAPLDDAERREIRDLYAEGWLVTDLSRRFGRRGATIMEIVGEESPPRS